MNSVRDLYELEENAIPHFDNELDAIEFDSGEQSRELSQGEKVSVLDRFEWFRNLQLSGKIKAIFGTFFAIGFALSLILGVGFTDLWTRSNDAAKVNDAAFDAVSLRGTAAEIRYNTSRYIFSEEPSALEQQRELVKLANDQIITLENVANDVAPSSTESISLIKEEMNSYDATFSELLTVIASQGRNQRATDLAFEISNRGEKLLLDTSALADELIKLRTDAEAEVDDYFYNLLVLAGFLVLVSGIVLLAGLKYLSRDYADKIGEITQGMTMLAQGNRHFTISGAERKDEVGAMVSALDLLKRANKRLETWAKERSERAELETLEHQAREQQRREQEAERSALVASMTAQFQRTVGDVVKGVSVSAAELQSTARTMAQTAEASNSRANDVAENMSDANSGATAAAAASDQFALSIAEISRQAASSSELARLASDATDEADSTISALADSAEQVGEIVELIQSIAQRTNLLALNASIEAARGGEAGRGFAVVASEVKELAMQTSRATEQVAGQIRAMQDTTGSSVGALRAIARQVRDLESTTISIASAVDQQSVAGQDLARSIDLAARGTERVSQSIGDLRELSTATGDAASKVLSSADVLEHQAATLTQQVEQFLRTLRSN